MHDLDCKQVHLGGNRTFMFEKGGSPDILTARKNTMFDFLLSCRSGRTIKDLYPDKKELESMLTCHFLKNGKVIQALEQDVAKYEVEVKDSEDEKSYLVKFLFRSTVSSPADKKRTMVSFRPANDADFCVRLSNHDIFTTENNSEFRRMKWRATDPKPPVPTIESSRKRTRHTLVSEDDEKRRDIMLKEMRDEMGEMKEYIEKMREDLGKSRQDMKRMTEEVKQVKELLQRDGKSIWSTMDSMDSKLTDLLNRFHPQPASHPIVETSPNISRRFVPDDLPMLDIPHIQRDSSRGSRGSVASRSLLNQDNKSSGSMASSDIKGEEQKRGSRTSSPFDVGGFLNFAQTSATMDPHMTHQDILEKIRIPDRGLKEIQTCDAEAVNKLFQADAKKSLATIKESKSYKSSLLASSNAIQLRPLTSADTPSVLSSSILSNTSTATTSRLSSRIPATSLDEKKNRSGREQKIHLGEEQRFVVDWLKTGTSSPREVLNLFFQKFHSDRKAPNYKTPRTPSQLFRGNVEFLGLSGVTPQPQRSKKEAKDKAVINFFERYLNLNLTGLVPSQSRISLSSQFQNLSSGCSSILVQGA